MSSETSGTERRGAPSTAPWDRSRTVDDGGHTLLVLIAAVAGLVAVSGRVAVLVGRNLPFDPIAVPASVRATTVVGAPIVLAVALLTVALASDRGTVRIGLVFVAVFGLLGRFVPETALPAAVAAVIGCGLAAFGALETPTHSAYRVWRRRAIAAGFVGAVAVSLASSVGVVSGGARGIGSVLALASLAALGTEAERDPIGLIAGVGAAIVTVVASGAKPYAAGSALLVGFGVVGVPHILVALAVGGGVAAAVVAVRHREYAIAAAVAVLMLAGVPATFPRAMAVALGLVIAVATVVPDRRESSEGDRNELKPEGTA